MNFYVLAGGLSKRFGQNKALFELNKSQTLIERVISAIPSKKQNIKIVTNTFREYRSLGIAMIRDLNSGFGPISGVHAGLVDSPHTYNFFLACDLPLISSDVINTILAAHSEQDIFGAATANGREPLCTLYSKKCIPVIERQFAAKHYSLHALFELVPSEFLTLEDSDVLFNMNTHADLERFKTSIIP